MDYLFENPNIPPRVAYAFADLMRLEGFNLDFTKESLPREFENVMRTKHLHQSQTRIMGRSKEVAFDFITAAACYLGHVLSTCYGGEWKGHCSASSSLNFYTLWLAFGEYRFYPIVYVNYRVGNGEESTGSIGSLLHSVEPSLVDGVDYKRRRHEAWMAEGRMIVDDKPWL